MYTPRRHGWQLPLHPLQVTGMVVYSLLVLCFYVFLGPFLGNRIATVTVLTVFSTLALSGAALFIRCTATDPSYKAKRHPKRKRVKLNYGLLLGQIVVRAFRRIERKILKTFIRRKYPLHPHLQLQPLLPFPLLIKEDYDHHEDGDENLSFCSLCNFHVHKHSKHCRTCNRCVEGFDHHCRWLNNCVGKRNYTTFILLMISVLLMLILEGGTAVAVFIRCFADKKGIEQELATELPVKFPRGLIVAFSVMLFVITAYGSAALGQLFFFHVVLIRKGMRTYDYILAMKEANMSVFSDSSDDSSSEPDSPTRPIAMSQFVFQSPERLAVRIDPDPWKLIQMSREKAFLATEKTKAKLAKEKQLIQPDLLHPLPLELKSGPLVKAHARFPGSPGRLSSPRRRFSTSPTTLSVPNHKYRNNFDLKLTQVSTDMESYISRQVLCTVLKEGSEASPR